MNIIVTGGGGFIGKQCCIALQQDGFNPVIVDDVSTINTPPAAFDFYKMSILDKPQLDNLFAKLRPVCVIHLAAKSIVTDSKDNYKEYFDTNITGTFNAIDAARASGCNNIVFASSAAVYGDPNGSIIEDNPMSPGNFYGWTKYVSELMIKQNGINFVNLRLFNVAGSYRQTGEDRKKETHLIPRILKNIIAGAPTQIYGDGKSVRDYVHVRDVAVAVRKSLIHLLGYNQSFTANVGSGTGTSILDVIDKAERISGKEVKLEFKPAREEEPLSLIADCSKIKQVLNWQPEYDLNSIIEAAWLWENRHNAY